MTIDVKKMYVQSTSLRKRSMYFFSLICRDCRKKNARLMQNGTGDGTMMLEQLCFLNGSRIECSVSSGKQWIARTCCCLATIKNGEWFKSTLRIQRLIIFSSCLLESYCRVHKNNRHGLLGPSSPHQTSN